MIRALRREQKMENDDNRFIFFYRSLLVLNVLVIISGAGIAILGDTFIYDPFNSVFDAYFWGDAPVPEQAQRFRAWVYGVLGGAMAGWGFCLYFIMRHAFHKKEKWAWNAISVSLVAWFILDTGASLWWGVTANVILNSAILVAFAVPLFATRRHFT